MFYTSIAPYYPYIFPFNPDQIEFLKQVIPYNGAKILDVGCAVGDLSFALTHFGFPTWGFDFDAQMVEIASNTKEEGALFPVFGHIDMRTLDQHYPESFFDSVICFGNTLVHLLTNDDIRKFIRAAYHVMVPEGKLTIQILNYQHILDHQINSLPLIDNEYIRFERRYRFTEGFEQIDFDTLLTVKLTGEEIPNSVKLHPVCQNKLLELLEEAGFKNFEFYGSFHSEPLVENSLPLIVICKK
jgi:glycine/sarcosine N-methyltransferase